MGFSLLPKEFEFYGMFENLAEQGILAVQEFKKCVSACRFDEEAVKKIKEIEKTGDRQVYEIIKKLNDTFITPFDREDIHVLAHELDSIVDYILKIANMMRIYKIDSINRHFIKEIDLIENSIITVKATISQLRDMKKIEPIMANIAIVNRLENEGDHLRNEVIGELFETGDAIYIMKWKDVFTTSEKLLDQCDDVAKIIESILVKQA